MTIRTFFTIAMAAFGMFSARADNAPEPKPLFEIMLDIDHDGDMDRAVLVLVNAGSTGFFVQDNSLYSLAGGESVDLHIYLGLGDEKLDLSRTPAFLKKAIIDPEETPWVQALESNAPGSLLINSCYGCGARQSSAEILTVVYRNGEFLVAGYTRDWEWGNEIRTEDGGFDVETIIGGCDINYLTGKGLFSDGLDEGKPLKEKFHPILLADWSTEKRPKACDW